MASIDPSLTVNSRDYWEQYFGGLWDQNNGRGQTASFMRSLVENLPLPERHYLFTRGANVLDWGCAFGDGVAVLADAFPRCDIAGLDFAERAVEEARRRFPRNEFLHVAEGPIGRSFDVITTSNCLEHFDDPIATLESHLPWCRKFYVALVPYRERPLIDCHHAQFRRESFPPQIGQFTRVFAEPIDVDQKHWTGQQLLVVYASREYLKEREATARQSEECARWQSHYEQLPNLGLEPAISDTGDALARELLEILPAGSSVLEAAAGRAWPALCLARTGRVRVSLMDLAPAALEYARRGFAAEGLDAELLADDVLRPGVAEHDLVMNAGWLARHSFHEQVSFLKGMASRSRKYVLAVVPNRLCYWYWMQRLCASTRGEWTFGRETPMVDLRAAFEAAGLRFVGHWIGGEKLTEELIANLPGLDENAREQILTVHRSAIIPRSQRGYYIAGLGAVANASVSTTRWRKTIAREDENIGELRSALANALSMALTSEQRTRELQAEVEANRHELSHLATDRAELETLHRHLQERIRELDLNEAELRQPIAQVSSFEHQRVVADCQDLLSQNSLLRERLAAIERSRSWRIALKLQAARMKTLPPESRRERAAKKLLRVGRSAPRRAIRGTLQTCEAITPDWALRPAKSFARRAIPRSVWNRLRALRSPYAGFARPGDAELEQNLRAFLKWAAEQPAQRIVVIVSGTTFTTSEGQRPTRLARELARRGVPVVFLYWRWDANEPIPARKCPEVLELPYDWFLARKQVLLESETIASLRRMLLMEYPQPGLVEIVNHASVQGWRTIYDVIDDWAEFQRAGQAVWYDADAELYLARNADVVTVTCPTLAEIAPLHGIKNIELVPNAFEDWTAAPPESQRDPRQVTIGYFGHLTKAWFDWELIAATAQRHAEWSFEIIGYGAEGGLRLPANVKLLGRVEHAELPKHAARWHAAMIPFKPSALAAAVDPIKIYEYIALGLRTVVTGMPHLSSYPGAHCAANLPEFEQAIQKAAQMRLDSKTVREFLAENRWSDRVDKLIGLADHGPTGVMARAVTERDDERRLAA